MGLVVGKTNPVVVSSEKIARPYQNIRHFGKPCDLRDGNDTEVSNMPGAESPAIEHPAKDFVSLAATGYNDNKGVPLGDYGVLMKMGFDRQIMDMKKCRK